MSHGNLLESNGAYRDPHRRPLSKDVSNINWSDTFPVNLLSPGDSSSDHRRSRAESPCLPKGSRGAKLCGRTQVFTSLAYGAKGVLYYCYNSEPCGRGGVLHPKAAAGVAPARSKEIGLAGSGALSRGRHD